VASPMSFADLERGGSGIYPGYQSASHVPQQPAPYAMSSSVGYGTSPNLAMSPAASKLPHAAAPTMASGTSTGNSGSNGGDAEYQRLYQTCLQNIKQISNAVAQISSLAQSLGTNKDSSSLREKLRAVIDSTRDLAKYTATDIKSLLSSTLYDKNKRLIVSKLQQEFQSWLEKFQDVSRTTAAREKASIPPQPAPTPTLDLMIDDPDARRRQEEQQALLFQKRSEVLKLDNQTDYYHGLVVERDGQVREIEGAVTEINEIFRDLARLAAEQSNMVDNIESSIEDTAHKTSAAVQQVHKAADSQRASRSYLCWILLAIIIFCALVVGIVFLGKKLTWF